MADYTVIDWGEKDTIQKLLIVLESDAGHALNTALQYKYFFEFFDSNPAFVNKAPHFWTEVVTGFKYSLLMQTARLFDESKDAIGMKKVMNVLEQSKYQSVVKNMLQKVKKEYNEYQNLIHEIRYLRDKVYAHNDKIVYRDGTYDGDDSLDSPLWGEVEELLRWIKNSLFAFRALCGENCPLFPETQNDIGNLLSKN